MGSCWLPCWALVWQSLESSSQWLLSEQLSFSVHAAPPFHHNRHMTPACSLHVSSLKQTDTFAFIKYTYCSQSIQGFLQNFDFLFLSCRMLLTLLLLLQKPAQTILILFPLLFLLGCPTPYSYAFWCSTSPRLQFLAPFCRVYFLTGPWGRDQLKNTPCSIFASLTFLLPPKLQLPNL